MKKKKMTFQKKNENEEITTSSINFPDSISPSTPIQQPEKNVEPDARIVEEEIADIIPPKPKKEVEPKKEEEVEARIVEENVAFPIKESISKIKEVSGAMLGEQSKHNKPKKDKKEIEKNLKNITKEDASEKSLKEQIIIPEKEKQIISEPVETNKKEEKVISESVETNKEERVEEENPIPILKTFHYDVRKLAETEGGAKLRTILAKELEEKKKAQEEYQKRTKDLLKESTILKKQYSDIKKEEELKEKAKQEIYEKDISSSIASAVNYMQHGTLNKEDGLTQKTEEDNSIQIDSIEPVKKSGFFSSLLKPKKELSFEQKELLKQEEEKIKKREGFKKVWKDFEEKKDTLKEEGAKIRNARQYGQPIIQNNILLRQNFTAIIIIIILIGGFATILFTVIRQQTTTPAIQSISTENLYETNDIIQSENSVFIDISTNKLLWEEGIVKEKDSLFTKFVPYLVKDNATQQASIEELFNSRDINLPQQFFNAFNTYYLIGSYTDKIQTNYVLILSVKNYSTAVTTLFNLEELLTPELIKLFPGVFAEPTTSSSVIFRGELIDNKSTKIFTDVKNLSHELLYYFFNRNYVVFIFGSTDSVRSINGFIRSTNQ